jgi:hypothetical protein
VGDTLALHVDRALFEQLLTRDDHGSRMRLDIGEPGPDGFYTPTVMVDHEDNPLRDERDRVIAERDEWRRVAYAAASRNPGVPGLISPFDAVLSRAKLWVLFARRDILGLPWEDEVQAPEPEYRSTEGAV